MSRLGINPSIVNIWQMCDYSTFFFSLSGTYRYFNQVLSNYGIETTFINTTDTALLEKTIKDNTKVGTCKNLHPCSSHFGQKSLKHRP